MISSVRDMRGSITIYTSHSRIVSQFNISHYLFLDIPHGKRYDFTEEIRLDPSGLVTVYLNRANAYYNTEQPRLAIADLKKALELSSDPEQIEKIKRQIQAIS